MGQPFCCFISVAAPLSTNEVKLTSPTVKAWPCFTACVYLPNETPVLWRDTKGSGMGEKNQFRGMIVWPQIKCLNSVKASSIF